MRYIVALALMLAVSSPAWACQVYTYIVNGQVHTCYVCPTYTTCS